MKAAGATLLAAVLVFCSNAGAEETLSTLDGNVVKYLKVLKKEPHSVTVETDSGITKVPYEKLSHASRKFFGMTESGFKEHKEKLMEEEITRELNAPESTELPDGSVQDASVPAASQANSPKGEKVPPVRLASVEKVKNYWIRVFPQPRSLDADYHNRRAAYVAFVERIRAGRYDALAKKAMLEWNISEFERVGDVEAANRCRGDLRGAVSEISAEKNRQLENDRIGAARMQAHAETEKARAIDRQASAIREKARASDRLASEIRSNTSALEEEAQYSKQLNESLNRIEFRWTH
jgi:hypothetical protein